MRPFGFIMFGLGLFIAAVGFVFIADTPDTSSWTCFSNAQSASTTCSYQAGDGNESNPGAGAKKSQGGLAVTIVGAALVAGGLACAGAGGRSGPPPGVGFPPAGGGQPGFPGYGQPGPAGPGGQPGRPPAPDGPFGTAR